MKTKQFIAGLTILTAAGSVLAEAPYPPEEQFVSTKTRAEVQAEVAQARKDGTLTISDANYPPEQHFVSTKTRAEVRAELAQARKDGTLTISDANYPPEPHFVSTKTRAEVRAEVAQARKDGMLTVSDSYPVIPTSTAASRAEVRSQIAKPASAIDGGS